jgi:alpha-galactosidase
MPVFGTLRGFTTDEYINRITRGYYEECKGVAPFMLGDYYPLTPYSLELDAWIAWQFNRPEEGDGMVQAFRRSRNEDVSSMTFRLRGLTPSAVYEVTDLDKEEPVQISGSSLLAKGLSVEITSDPGSALIVYRKVTE